MDNLEEYESFLSSLKLDKSLFWVKTVEQNLYGKLNPGQLLDRLFFKENRWLNFDDFFKLYIEENKFELNSFKNQHYSNMSKNDFLHGIRARLYRTQFGFLTEYHAFLLCKKVFGDSLVTRDFSLDRIGVDFQINFNETIYNIHIFVDTERGWYYRNIKSRYRNVEQAAGIHVNFPYSLNAGKINSLRYLGNGFGVYPVEYVIYLKEQMSKATNLDHITGIGQDGFRF